MARLYGAWPWIRGRCEACPQHAEHPNDWVMQCSRCWRRFCENWPVDGCFHCGYPFCAFCYRDHICTPGALLTAFPVLKCRFCELPQDIGNGQNRCQRCFKCACVGEEVGEDHCRSKITTTHCPCGLDLCMECASWQWSTRRSVVSIPRRPFFRIPVPRQARRYICNLQTEYLRTMQT
jgi:hypothetical protein